MYIGSSPNIIYKAHILFTSISSLPAIIDIRNISISNIGFYYADVVYTTAFVYVINSSSFAFYDSILKVPE